MTGQSEPLLARNRIPQDHGAVVASGSEGAAIRTKGDAEDSTGMADEVVDSMLNVYCPPEQYPEEWDLDELHDHSPTISAY